MGVDTGKWHYVDNESRYSYRWIDLRSDWVKKEIRDIFRKENWCVFSLVLGSLNAKCVNRFMDHEHYVQGVSWDPRNKYILTQSRSALLLLRRSEAGHIELITIPRAEKLPSLKQLTTEH